MAEYANPAGRLHALLEELAEHSDGQRFRDAWAEVLEVEPDRVKLRLGRVGLLLEETEQAVQNLGDRAFIGLMRDNLTEWEVAIFPESGYDQPLGHASFNPGSLVPLAAVSSHLHAVRTEGNVPSEERIDELKTKVEALIDEVMGTGELPDEVRELVVTRLQDILRALDDVHVGGPRAVRRAVEVLISEIDLHQANRWSQFSRNKIATLAAIIWFAFGAPHQTAESWEGWERLVGTDLHQILPPEDHPPGREQPLLPPGVRPELEGDRADDGPRELGDGDPDPKANGPAAE